MCETVYRVSASCRYRLTFDFFRFFCRLQKLSRFCTEFDVAEPSGCGAHTQNAHSLRLRLHPEAVVSHNSQQRLPEAWISVSVCEKWFHISLCQVKFHFISLISVRA